MNESIEIPTRLKSASIKAIHHFDAAYFNEDGIATVQKTLDKKREGVARHIFRLARSAYELDPKKAGELFKAACDYAEAEYKAEHKITAVKDRLPAWAQFKSRLLRAIKHGIDLTEHKSERAVRDALSEKIAQRKVKRANAEGLAEPDEVREGLSQLGVQSSLVIQLQKLVLAAELIRPMKRLKAQEILETAANELADLLDQRRVRAQSEQTRELLGATH